MERNKKLDNAMEKLKTAWEGQASNDFRVKCENLAELIRNEVKNIRDIANGLERSAKAISDAEKEAQNVLANDSVRNQ